MQSYSASMGGGRESPQALQCGNVSPALEWHPDLFIWPQAVFGRPWRLQAVFLPAQRDGPFDIWSGCCTIQSEAKQTFIRSALLLSAGVSGSGALLLTPPQQAEAGSWAVVSGEVLHRSAPSPAVLLSIIRREAAANSLFWTHHHPG